MIWDARNAFYAPPLTGSTRFPDVGDGGRRCATSSAFEFATKSRSDRNFDSLSARQTAGSGHTVYNDGHIALLLGFGQRSVQELLDTSPQLSATLFANPQQPLP